MKHSSPFITSASFTTVVLAWAALVFVGAVPTAHAQGTTITYQGWLNDTNGPVTGLVNMTFGIYAASNGISPLWEEVASSVPATNGLFTVELGRSEPLDEAILNGGERWLEIVINGTALAGRQKLTPAPYAITAGHLAGTFPASQLTGTLPSANLGGTYSGAITFNNASNSFSGGGAGLTGLNAAQLASGTVPDARLGANVARTNQVWLLGGNAGTTAGTHFMGTADNQALEIKANSQRALRLEPNGSSPNVIAGHSANIVSNGIWGAALGGGGTAGVPNKVGGSYGTVSGGLGNTSSGFEATVGGGAGNTSSGENATVAGGMNNIASGNYSVIGGGNYNFAMGVAAVVPGGSNNLAQGSYSLAAGRRARAVHPGAFVWADTTDAEFASTAGNQFLIRSVGGVGIGTNNPQSALHVAGTVTASAFSGSGANLTSLNASTLSSGTVLEARVDAAIARDSEVVPTVLAHDGAGSGLDADLLDGLHAASFAVLGHDHDASYWKLGGNSGTTPATHFLGTTDGQPLEMKVNGSRVLRLEPGVSSPNLISGHAGNYLAAGLSGAVLLGGGTGSDTNQVLGSFGVALGGLGNTASGDNAIVMGIQNTAAGLGSTAMGRSTLATGDYAVAMGQQTVASNSYAVAMGIGSVARARASTAMGWNTLASGDTSTAMGYGSIASGSYSTAMGWSSKATGPYAAVALGQESIAAGHAAVAMGYQARASNDVAIALGDNTLASGWAATAMGYGTVASGMDSTAMGSSTTASNDFTMAAGRRAKAYHIGAFVWADSTDADFASTGSNQFLIRAQGGMGINKNNPATALDVNGTVTASAFVGSGAGLTGLPNPHALDAPDGEPIDVVNVDNAGRVGILTAPDPAYLLNVGGPVHATVFHGSGANLTDLPNGHALDAPDGDPINVVNVDNAGRVGILTAPDSGYVLNVGGPVRASTFFGNGQGIEGVWALDAQDGSPKGALVVDNSGQVGIGTATPQDAFELRTTSGAFLRVDGGFNNNTGLRLCETNGLRWTMFMRGWQDEDLEFYDEVGSRTTMVLQSGTGRVGIGRNPASNALEVAGDASKNTAGSWLANSDARIKRDIQPVRDALETLARVRPVSFRYTENYRAQHEGIVDRRYLNVVAQEFAEVFPEHVKPSGEKLPDGSDILQVDTYPLTIYSAAAIQELNQKLEQKEGEIADLKARLEKLEQRLEQRLNGGTK